MQLAVKTGLFESDIASDRRDLSQDAERGLGRVVSCDGSRATIASTVAGMGRLGPESWTVGRMISINLGTTRIVGLVYEMHSVNPVWDEATDNVIHVQVELLGEVSESKDGRASFQSGISTYPPIGG